MKSADRPTEEGGGDGRRESLLAWAEEANGSGSWELDPGDGKLFWSDNMFRLLGLEPESIEPTVDDYLAMVHADDRERVTSELELLVEGRLRINPMNYRIVRPDGEVAYLRSRHSEGEGTFRGSARDVTEQRSAEQRASVLGAVADATESWRSLDESAAELLAAVGSALDALAAYLWAPGEGGLRCRGLWGSGAIDTGPLELVCREAKLLPGIGLPGRAWDGRVSSLRADEPRDRLRSRAMATAGLAGGLAFPIGYGDERLAVVEVLFREPADPDDAMLATLRAAGYLLGEFLSHRRAELESTTLTSRELEILQLAAEGLSGPRIAERLVISPATVKSHFEHIYPKLEVTDRPAAVAMGLRLGLIR